MNRIKKEARWIAATARQGEWEADRQRDRDRDKQTVYFICTVQCTLSIYIFMCTKCTVVQCTVYTHSAYNICVLVVNICAKLVRVFVCVAASVHVRFIRADISQSILTDEEQNCVYWRWSSSYTIRNRNVCCMCVHLVFFYFIFFVNSLLVRPAPNNVEKFSDFVLVRNHVVIVIVIVCIYFIHMS